MAAYTTIDDPSVYFRVKLFVGNSSTQSITFDETDTNMQPDLVWIKNRDHANHNVLFDAVRGTSKVLYANLTHAEATVTGVTAFDSNGFTLGNDSDTNRNPNNHVSWSFKANGSGSANTEGNTDTTISANTTAGFSIIDGCDNLNDNDTFGHGLTSAPNLVILKRTDDTSGWRVFYTGITSGSTLALQDTDAVHSDNDCIKSVSSTLITIKGSGTGGSQGSGQNVAYAFQNVQGYGKVGTYKGNGNADGTFVYTGFRPAWLMLKRTDAADSWFMYHNKRSPFNVVDDYLIADGNGAEVSTSAVNLDLLSNGFKIRNTDNGHNNSSGTYLYIAFAESPFVNSNGVPNNAR
nr:hypothetical protein [uncultured Mediterranean phage uvMED]